MIHRMRQFNDLDANLWEFYVEDNTEFKYRVIDVSLPLPGLENTTLNTGQKYWSDVAHPEEITVTFRETDNSYIFSFLWLWQEQIYDFENKVFRTGENQETPGAKKTGYLNIQRPKFGGLLNYARIKFLQSDPLGVKEQVGGNQVAQGIGQIGGQAAQIADIVSDGIASEAIENFLFANSIEFKIPGMRVKKIEDMSFSYGNTDGKNVSATFIVDDVKVNTDDLWRQFSQFLGMQKGLQRATTIAGNLLG